MDSLKLSKPIFIDGKEVSEIEYNLESLTAESVDQVSNELKKQQYMVISPELDPKFCAGLFAMAAGHGINDIKNMSAKDYFKAGSIVKDFLFRDSEE